MHWALITGGWLAFRCRFLGRAVFAILLPTHGKGPTLDSQGAALHQGLGHFDMRGVKHPAKGRPGNPHPFCGGLLVEPFFVGEAECLKLFHRQSDLLEHRQWHRPRLEVGHAGHLFDALAARTTGQGFLRIPFDHIPGRACFMRC